MQALKPSHLSALLLAGLIGGMTGTAHAHGTGHHGGISTEGKKAVKAPFDVVHTRISTDGKTAVFHMAVSGKAGATRPTKSGKLAGSSVFS